VAISPDRRKRKVLKKKYLQSKPIKMRNQKAGWLLVALFILVGIAGFAFFKKDGKINISVSETNNDVSVIAEFPDEKSKRVQDHLRTALNLTDLPDLTHLEIKHYQTPDRLMRFYIKSKSGYVKLKMNKAENNIQAQAKLKQAGDLINEALTK
jgi:hypothetical protein